LEAKVCTSPPKYSTTETFLVAKVMEKKKKEEKKKEKKKEE